jgi:hypothetical protein
VVITFLFLKSNKIPAPLIVLGCLLLGWLVWVVFRDKSLT